MKQYLEIPVEANYEKPIWMWGKLDGSNIRCEWNRKKGWTLFGSRKKIIGPENLLQKATDLVKRDFADSLAEISRKNKFEEIVAFFEFLGPNSFAGRHVHGDEFKVVLIDISVHRKGILHPQRFQELFGHLPSAPLLYQGVLTRELTDAVEHGIFPGMPFEGVVCKGDLISPGRPLMFKIKNKNWIVKLKEFCGNNEELFQELL